MNVRDIQPIFTPKVNAFKGGDASSLKAVDVFHTQRADDPVPTAQQVRLSFNPQEPGLMDPEELVLNKDDVKPGLVSDRIRIAEPSNFPTPTPDAKGNYIFAQDDPRFDATESFSCATLALKMAQNYLGRQLPWGFSKDLGRNQLIVHPHAGTGVANAFYKSDSGSLNFFSFTDPLTNETLRTGDASDIVSHETGHALLDAIRHDYISAGSVSSSGFHESFGDMTAMLVALHDDTVLNKLWEQTHGDLTVPNVVANLAEKLGDASAHMSGSPDGPGYLRNAINPYKYADQHFLPMVDPKTPNSAPGQEAHAYSNLFTGAFYDIFSTIYGAATGDASTSFKDSVAKARDVAGKLLYKGMEFAPVGDISYKSAALAMIKADEVDNGGAYRPVLEAVFKDRQILSDDDLQDYDEQQAKLPALNLDKKVKDEASAMKFLDANRKTLGLPADKPFKFVDLRKNDEGQTFLLYDFTTKFNLDGTDFGTLDGSQMETTGGLLLAFDKTGKLIDENYQDVSDNDKQDMRDYLKAAVADGDVSMSAPVVPTQASVTNAKGVPYLNLTVNNGVVKKSSTIWG